MKRSENKSRKAKIPKLFTVISVLLVCLALLSFFSSTFRTFFGGSSDSPGGTVITPGENEEQLPENKTIAIDTNVMLVQNSHGEAYVKSAATDLINNKSVVCVTNKASGDYILADFTDVSFASFLESNHTQLKISFDLIGVESFVMPGMNISLIYSGTDVNFDVANVKISSLEGDSISCIAAAKSSEPAVLGSFDAIAKHTLEYVFMKNADGTIALQVVFGEFSETVIYSGDFSEMSLNSLKIALSNADTETAAVRVENLTVGYIPALSAFPGESIVIPVDSTVTALGDKVNPLYNVYNHGGLASVNDNNTLVIAENAPANAYSGIYLKDDNKSINIFDYDYITIEYDVSVVEGASPVSFIAYLLGRPNGSLKQYMPSYTWFYVDENQIYGLNSEKANMTESVDKIHVKYVIAGNKLQVFFNDVLYYDAVEVFNETNNCIEELRINNFKNSGSIQFTNLKVNGYNIADN